MDSSWVTPEIALIIRLVDRYLEAEEKQLTLQYEAADSRYSLCAAMYERAHSQMRMGHPIAGIYRDNAEVERRSADLFNARVVMQSWQKALDETYEARRNLGIIMLGSERANLMCWYERSGL